MTWYLVRETGDIYDHDETLVESIDTPYRIYDDIYDVMRDNMEGNQPSAYNEAIIADAALNQITIVESETDLPFDP